MHSRCLALVVLFALSSPGPAAVIVVGNYTTGELSFTITVPGEKSRKHTLPAHQVLPVTLTGPADLTTTTTAGKPLTVRVEPYNAYVFLPDRNAGLAIEMLELPGQAPERDNRAELNPQPRDPVKLPVTLLVDDADPRAVMVWQTDIHKRFNEASATLEAQTGIRLELAGFETWKSDPNAKQVEAQLATFEGTVKVKPNTLAVGFTSRKLEASEKAPFGACRGLGASHVLVREWQPRSEPERVEVLVHYLAMALGAVTSPDPGSAMRAKLGDGQAVRAGFVIRLDPLNALALNLWADQRRARVTDPGAVPQVDRVRFVRVYRALSAAFPGDPHGTDYLALLEKDQPRVDEPMEKKDVRPLQDRARRTAIAREVVRAITERAKANSGPNPLTGDALTAALLRAGAESVLKADTPEQISGFLLGIGIALDDTASLRDNPLTSAAVKDVESDVERAERQAVLGNPTMRSRRDLCRRFAVGCASGELLSATTAENGVTSAAMFDLHRPAGLSFPCLAAEFGGIGFAGRLHEHPELLKQLGTRLTPASLLPDTAGLRDGLGAGKFEDEFGSSDDERFRAALAEIRKRVIKP